MPDYPSDPGESYWAIRVESDPEDPALCYIAATDLGGETVRLRVEREALPAIAATIASADPSPPGSILLRSDGTAFRRTMTTWEEEPPLENELRDRRGQFPRRIRRAEQPAVNLPVDPPDEDRPRSKLALLMDDEVLAINGDGL